MQPIHLGLIDLAILVIYFGFVLGIGYMLKRHMRTSTDFFLSGRFAQIRSRANRKDCRMLG